MKCAPRWGAEVNATLAVGPSAVASAEGALTPDHALSVLRDGSRTFSFAGRFLAADRLADAALLYAFCRRVDDLADDAPDADAGAEALASVWAGLRGEGPRAAWIEQLVALFERRGIDVAIAEELVFGVGSDLGTVRVADDGELVRYGYRVASTVGLMMCGVLGVVDPVAAPFAVDLGVAMQLTNICRDVAEDARLGRVYLPADRLLAAGVTPTPEGVLADGDGVARVVVDVLDLAERYYASADSGMRFIPWRARLAIHVASRVYRAIGLRLRRTLARRAAGSPVPGRTVVPGWEKAVWACVGVVAWMRSWRWGGAHDPSLHVALRGLPGADEAGAAAKTRPNGGGF
jgi:phytoene synthase